MRSYIYVAVFLLLSAQSHAVGLKNGCYSLIVSDKNAGLFCFDGLNEESQEDIGGVRQISVLGKITANDVVKFKNGDQTISFTFDGIEHTWSVPDENGSGDLVYSHEGQFYKAHYRPYRATDAGQVYEKAFAFHDEKWSECNLELANLYMGLNSDGSSFLKHGKME